MIIGFFKEDGYRCYKGHIKTLAFDADAHIRPFPKETPDAPDWRVDDGCIQFGVAWKRPPTDNHGYPLVRLNCPSVQAPIFCTLVPTNKGWLLDWDTPPLTPPAKTAKRWHGEVVAGGHLITEASPDFTDEREIALVYAEDAVPPIEGAYALLDACKQARQLAYSLGDKDTQESRDLFALGQVCDAAITAAEPNSGPWFDDNIKPDERHTEGEANG